MMRARPFLLAAAVVLIAFLPAAWRMAAWQREQLAAERATIARREATIRAARTQLAKVEAEQTEADRALAAARAAGSGEEVSPARVWAGRIAVLKQLLRELPRQGLPELRLLGALDWIQAVRESELDTPEKLRAGLAALRGLARRRFAEQLQTALKAFVDKSGGELPSDIHELAALLTPPADREMLDRYTMKRSGRVGTRDETLIVERAASDMILSVSLDGWGITNGPELLTAPGESEMDALARAAAGIGDAVDPEVKEWTQQFLAGTRELLEQVVPAVTDGLGPSFEIGIKESIRRYHAANSGEPLTNFAQLLPFLDQAAKFTEIVRPFFARWEYLKENGHLASDPAQLRPYLERPFNPQAALKDVKIQWTGDGEHGTMTISFGQQKP